MMPHLILAFLAPIFKKLGTCVVSAKLNSRLKLRSDVLPHFEYNSSKKCSRRCPTSILTSFRYRARLIQQVLPLPTLLIVTCIKVFVPVTKRSQIFLDAISGVSDEQRDEISHHSDLVRRFSISSSLECSFCCAILCSHRSIGSTDCKFDARGSF